ncbi:hypothetical protein [Enterococcus casseliflavus]|uniref:hypothetical protein n=1 Tax=Enterococcus casseliflavus TaxID=37734 RepID=UPI0028A1FD90|nr:hypothetical protein [Enterococcus casseliflavus]
MFSITVKASACISAMLVSNDRCCKYPIKKKIDTKRKTPTDPAAIRIRFFLFAPDRPILITFFLLTSLTSWLIEKGKTVISFAFNSSILFEQL